MHIDMPLDIATGICTYMRMNMCLDGGIDWCRNIFIDVCIDMRVDMRVDVCIGTGIDTCIDVCTGARTTCAIASI